MLIFLLRIVYKSLQQPIAMQSLFEQFKGLSPAIYALSFAKMVSALGAFVAPFLTLTLNVHLNMEPVQIGWFIALVGAFGIFGTVVGGWVADWISHRRVLLVGMTVAGLSYGVGGFWVDSTWLVAFLCLATLATGIMYPAHSAFIAEITPRERRKAAIGLSYMGVNIGFAVGPMMAAFFFHQHPAWIFWGDGITTLLAVLVVALGTKNTKSIVIPETDHPESAVKGTIWRVLKARPKIIAFALSSLLLSICYAQVGFTLPLVLTGTIGVSGTHFYGVVMMVNGLFAMIWTPIITKYVKCTALKALSGAGLTYVIGFGGYAFLPSLIALTSNPDDLPVLVFVVLSTTVWTAGEVITVAIGAVFIANETPESHRGRLNGVLSMTYQMAKLGTPIVMGMLLETMNFESIWIVVGLIATLATAAFFWSDQRWPTNDAHQSSMD